MENPGRSEGLDRGGEGAGPLRAVEGLDHPRVWRVSADVAGEQPEPLCSSLRVWGLTLDERWRRTFLPGRPPPRGLELVVAEDLVLDEKVATALAQRRGAALLDEAGRPVAVCVDAPARAEAGARIARGRGLAEGSGLHSVRAEDLVDRHDPRLRKSEPPVVARLASVEAQDLEARLFSASYKGVTDFVTAWVWPRPARAATKLCVRLGVSPNTVTILSWLLVIAAMLLFARGDYGLGLVAAWWMTFLDTVDGKLARVTLRSTRIGHVLDHGLDITHPPFWYGAWAMGLAAPPTWWDLAAWVVIGGYVAGRLVEGLFILIFRMETHSWRPLDSWFRTITARRNPNLVLLTGATLAGRPDLGFAAVAVWTLLSLGFHAVRLLQAGAARLRGRSVEPWYLRAPAAEAR